MFNKNLRGEISFEIFTHCFNIRCKDGLKTLPCTGNTKRYVFPKFGYFEKKVIDFLVRQIIDEKIDQRNF